MDTNTEYQWPYNGSKLIPKDKLKPFLQRNNRNGLIHLAMHLGLIFFSGILVSITPNILIKVILMIAHGSFIAFLYAGLHECIHKSAFKNKKLNEFVGYFIGFVLLRSFLNGRYRHMAHHTFTQHPEKDPDKVDFPSSYLEYLKHVTSLSVWIRIVDNLFRHALGKINKSEIFRTSLVDFRLPKKKIFLLNLEFLDICSSLALSGPSPTKSNLTSISLEIPSNAIITSSILLTFLKLDT